MWQVLFWCNNLQIFFLLPPKVAPALLGVAYWSMFVSVSPSCLITAKKVFRDAGKPTGTFGLSACDPQLRADAIQHFFFGISQVNGKEAEVWAAPKKLGHPGKEERRTPG